MNAHEHKKEEKEFNEEETEQKECSCDCGDNCECGEDCNCGCNSEEISVKELAYHADDKIDALIQLLIKKKIIAESEFEEAYNALFEETEESEETDSDEESTEDSK